MLALWHDVALLPSLALKLQLVMVQASILCITGIAHDCCCKRQDAPGAVGHAAS